MFIDLVQNVALLLALGLLYDIIVLKPQRAKPSLQQLFIGVAIGAIGIAVMLSPWEFTPGIIFDTRSILLAIAGLFFGTVSTLIAVLMTAVLRLYQGGGGVWMGVGVIVTSGGIGIAWRNPGIVTLTLGDKGKEESLNFISGNTEGLSYE